MNSKSIITVLVVVVILILGFFVFNSEKANAPETTETGIMEEDRGDIAESEPAVIEFNVTGTPFEFSVKEIKVNRGDKVRINFENGQGTHDWVIDEFNTRTSVIQTGEKASVEFVADKAGEFEYYCSVGNHRALGMAGKLVVE